VDLADSPDSLPLIRHFCIHIANQTLCHCFLPPRTLEVTVQV
jgi:hypothetical protein